MALPPVQLGQFGKKDYGNMSKTVTRKMAVDCLLWLIEQPGGTILASLPDRTGPPRGYFRCYICEQPIVVGQEIQFDHIHADVHEGPHEYQNLRPVHYDPCHKQKTARDIKANAKVKRLRGERKPKPKRLWPSREIPSRPWPK